MKGFIKQLLLFFSLIVILFIYLNYSARNKILNYKLSSKINKLVIGDSHTERAIDDALLCNTKNFSIGGEGLIYSFFKLQTLLKNNHQVDTVFLGVGYHNFSASSDKYVLSSYYSAQYIFALPIEMQIYLLKNVNNPLRMILECFRNGIANWMNSVEKSTFLGSYENWPLIASSFVSDALIESRIKNYYYLNGKLDDLSNSNIYFYNKIKELCASNKIKLIILNPPVHVKYKKMVPLKFKSIYDSVTNDEMKDVIEFNELKLNANDFLDPDHVSESGAILTSQYLNELIKAKR